MAAKPQSQTGKSAGGDRVADESAWTNYIGTGAGTTTPTRKALTTSYQDNTAIDTAQTDAVIDMEDYDTLLVTADIAVASGTGVAIKFMYGESDATAELLTQEVREDNATASIVKYEFVEHQFATTGVRTIIAKRMQRFMKIQAKELTADSTIAIRYAGHVREGGGG